MRIAFLLLLIPGLLFAQKKDSRTVYSNTKTYDQVIAEYQALDAQSDMATLSMTGATDGGKPFYVFTLSHTKGVTPNYAKISGQVVIMINNGIHPGEPDG